jgi:hypothetical protein
VPVVCNEFDVSLTIIHPQLAIAFGIVPIIECTPLAPGFTALLGRDLLAHCVLIYHGQANPFSLSF